MLIGAILQWISCRDYFTWSVWEMYTNRAERLRRRFDTGLDLWVCSTASRYSSFRAWLTIVDICQWPCQSYAAFIYKTCKILFRRPVCPNCRWFDGPTTQLIACFTHWNQGNPDWPHWDKKSSTRWRPPRKLNYRWFASKTGLRILLVKEWSMNLHPVLSTWWESKSVVKNTRNWKLRLCSLSFPLWLQNQGTELEDCGRAVLFLVSSDSKKSTLWFQRNRSVRSQAGGHFGEFSIKLIWLIKWVGSNFAVFWKMGPLRSDWDDVLVQVEMFQLVYRLALESVRLVWLVINESGLTLDRRKLPQSLLDKYKLMS